MALDMPLIPVLAGDDDVQAPSLTDLLTNLSDDDIAYMEEQAAAFAAGGEEVPEGEETVADEAAEGDEEQAAEEAAGTEQHSARDGLEACRAAKYEVDDGLRDLNQLVEDADVHKKAGVDMEALNAQLDLATEAAEAAETCMETASEAVESDDVQAASEAAVECGKQSAIIQKALKAAQMIISKSAKEAMGTAVPEEVLQFDAWAKRVAGGAA